MPWNRTTCEEYKREAVRYESDAADVEWALVETFPDRVRWIVRERGMLMSSPEGGEL